MKVAVGLFLFACVLCVMGGEECGDKICGDDQCCSGSFYNRHCRRFALDGEPCEPRSREIFKTSCPCDKGLICSVIRYCQTPY